MQNEETKHRREYRKPKVIVHIKLCDSDKYYIYILYCRYKIFLALPSSLC